MSRSDQARRLLLHHSILHQVPALSLSAPTQRWQHGRGGRAPRRGPPPSRLLTLTLTPVPPLSSLVSVSVSVAVALCALGPALSAEYESAEELAAIVARATMAIANLMAH
eukprot:2810178-Rhodomonas_salina.1